MARFSGWFRAADEANGQFKCEFFDADAVEVNAAGALAIFVRGQEPAVMRLVAPGDWMDVRRVTLGT